ncbi:hypothetical protein [Lacrimispora sp.]|uniref:IS1096 element passenger TnpR family protein n=1 Tax=Lacrimispora sp. TaxID=2719234 RepID=UPI00345FD3B6
MSDIKQKLYEDIISIYLDTGSVKETAKRLGTYPIKVRRVLITEDLWKSNTSQKVGQLYKKGVAVAEIAKVLFMSEKNVQSYLPYTRGQYGGGIRSNEAMRSDEYRVRKSLAVKFQVRNKGAFAQQEFQNIEMEMGRMMRLNITEERNSQLDGGRPIPYAIKLHLKLDNEEQYLDDSEREILRKYGKMKEWITRDFIVPGDITLHALHYAINKAFGWQNSHLHSFHPYEKDYEKMVKGGLLVEWNKLAGMYFRFPTDDYEDLYWDDDYEPSVSVKTWLRRKYTGPYYYGGTREYYDRCQEEVQKLISWKPVLEVRKSFGEWYVECKELAEKSGDKADKADMIKRIVPITDVTVRELEDTISFDGAFDELIERLPLYDILLMPDEKQDFNAWHFANGRILKKIESDQACLAPVTTPILKELRYWYDYGDNWNIKITAVKVYAAKADYIESGYSVQPLEEHRPICVETDGLPLCDDVGGLGGYCNMLEVLHGDDPAEKEDFRVWSRGMGWTGRSSKPENIL